MKNGFALIEIMLVIAIVLTVGFFAGAFPLRLILNSEVQDAASEFRGIFYKAQAYALSGREHSAWGVHYGAATITLFKGDSFANRDRNFDEAVKINDKISVAGFSETIFSRPGGRPSVTIPAMTLERGGVTAGLSLNAEGVVE